MVALVEPVSPQADRKPRGPSDGIGISVSGGGYRAMLFHLGAFLRLFETELLQRSSRISSVSGGSITSAKIALEWHKLSSRDDFFQHVVKPIRRVASTTIDWPATAAGVLFPARVSDFVAMAYRALLFGNATLQNLPRRPEFLINATNMETGTLWRFTRRFMGDYQVGEIAKPTLPLASAVAASAAFPPFLSPYLLRVGPEDFSDIWTEDPVFLSDISLTDGGVYDNLGLETVWKSYRNVLVSNASAKPQETSSPASNWPGHSWRVIGIIHNQVASLRKRQLIASYKAREGERGWRRGAYWGIDSEVGNYHLSEPLPVPPDRAKELAEIPTRLKRLSPELQERLINWGYAICDTAIRKHVLKGLPKPSFPYPIGV